MPSINQSCTKPNNYTVAIVILPCQTLYCPLHQIRARAVGLTATTTDDDAAIVQPVALLCMYSILTDS